MYPFFFSFVSRKFGKVWLKENALLLMGLAMFSELKTFFELVFNSLDAPVSSCNSATILLGVLWELDGIGS